MGAQRRSVHAPVLARVPALVRVEARHGCAWVTLDRPPLNLIVPELIAEVAHSSKAIDLGSKRKDYLAAGVQEYLVYCVEEQEIHWFHFPAKRKLKGTREGLWKSRVFPGLWLDGPALIARDSARLVACVQQGLATAEHAAFVRRLEERRRSGFSA